MFGSGADIVVLFNKPENCKPLMPGVIVPTMIPCFWQFDIKWPDLRAIALQLTLKSFGISENNYSSFTQNLTASSIQHGESESPDNNIADLAALFSSRASH